VVRNGHAQSEKELYAPNDSAGHRRLMSASTGGIGRARKELGLTSDYGGDCRTVMKRWRAVPFRQASLAYGSHDVPPAVAP
jgi:hypothetical protein